MKKENHLLKFSFTIECQLKAKYNFDTLLTLVPVMSNYLLLDNSFYIPEPLPGLTAEYHNVDNKEQS